MQKRIVVAGLVLGLGLLGCGAVAQAIGPCNWGVTEHHGEGGFHVEHVAELHIDFESGEAWAVDYDGGTWVIELERDSVLNVRNLGE